jgi:hypothetical protein
LYEARRPGQCSCNCGADAALRQSGRDDRNTWAISRPMRQWRPWTRSPAVQAARGTASATIRKPLRLRRPSSARVLLVGLRSRKRAASSCVPTVGFSLAVQTGQSVACACLSSVSYKSIARKNRPDGLVACTDGGDSVQGLGGASQSHRASSADKHLSIFRSAPAYPRSVLFFLRGAWLDPGGQCSRWLRYQHPAAYTFHRT